MRQVLMSSGSATFAKIIVSSSFLSTPSMDFSLTY
jgi:hypothetical protein